MTLTFEIDGRNVIVNNFIIYVAQGDIGNAIENYNEETLIIFYHFPEHEEAGRVPDKIANRNIVKIDRYGDIVWRVQQPRSPEGLQSWGYLQMRHQDNSGEIWAYDGGFDNRIDPGTGNIVERIFTK